MVGYNTTLPEHCVSLAHLPQRFPSLPLLPPRPIQLRPQCSDLLLRFPTNHPKNMHTKRGEHASAKT
jgi:hypothetical protein